MPSSPMKYSPPSSSLTSEGVATSSQEFKQKKRKSGKNRQEQGGKQL